MPEPHREALGTREAEGEKDVEARRKNQVRDCGGDS